MIIEHHLLSHLLILLSAHTVLVLFSVAVISIQQQQFKEESVSLADSSRLQSIVIEKSRQQEVEGSLNGLH